MADPSHSSESDSLARVSGESSRFRVPLKHFFYATAMVSATLAVFGPWAILLAVCIVGFWAWIFLQSNRPRRLFESLGVLLVLSCMCSAVLPAVRGSREAARRSSCSNNLKQIALALHNYHDIYKSFPPAYIADAEGRPMHSWRVLILPFMEASPLYDQYRFDEPWDGPNNRTLAAQMPFTYGCPSDRRQGQNDKPVTSYVAVVGPGTAWPHDQSCALDDFADGTSNTVLVLESHGEPIHWMEPRDLTYEDAMRALTSPTPTDSAHVREAFFHLEAHGRNMAMADGSVQFVRRLSEAMAAQSLGVASGPIQEDAGKHAYLYHKQPNYGNWFRLGVFLLLQFLPLPWVWLHPHRPAGPQSRRPETPTA